MSDGVPEVVTLHVWGVTSRDVTAALLAMATDRARVRRLPGLRFAKLLGTGDGRTFTARDVDAHHWGLLACWGSRGAADDFEGSAVARAWAGRATETLRVAMTPVASTGWWSGRQPFGAPQPRPVDGPVAAVTRARLRPSRAAAFWRAVPPVSARLQQAPGLLLALGIGEAPVGLQGTFSLWRSAADLRDFAHRSPEHLEVIRRTAETGWYAEELFARFAVERASGSLGGAVLDLAAPAPAGGRR